MAHGIGIKSIGDESATSVGDVVTDPGIDIPSRMDGRRPADSRSGTWKITWRGGADRSDDFVRTFHDLFERQLNGFSGPRVFLLDDIGGRDLAKISARADVVVAGQTSASASGGFDVVWDAGLLSRVQLTERLKLVQVLDSRLRVGGTCIIVTHGKRAGDDALASLSPEEIAAYFFPAYVVQRHEEHEFAMPPGEPVAFHTLVLLKQSSLTSEMLDPELHRSLHAVASRRRTNSA